MMLCSQVYVFIKNFQIHAKDDGLGEVKSGGPCKNGFIQIKFGVWYRVRYSIVSVPDHCLLST